MTCFDTSVHAVTSPRAPLRRIAPCDCGAKSAYAIATVTGPLNCAVVDTEYVHGPNRPPELVGGLFAVLRMRTDVLPATDTFVNRTRKSRATTTDTSVPVGVNTPSGDPSSGGSGSPNGLPGAGVVVEPGVTVSVTAPPSGHSSARVSDANVKPPVYVPTGRLPGEMV